MDNIYQKYFTSIKTDMYVIYLRNQKKCKFKELRELTIILAEQFTALPVFQSNYMNQINGQYTNTVMLYWLLNEDIIPKYIIYMINYLQDPEIFGLIKNFMIENLYEYEPIFPGLNLHLKSHLGNLSVIESFIYIHLNKDLILTLINEYYPIKHYIIINYEKIIKYYISKGVVLQLILKLNDIKEFSILYGRHRNDFIAFAKQINCTKFLNIV
jgi:hypothetical protein